MRPSTVVARSQSKSDATKQSYPRASAPRAGSGGRGLLRRTTFRRAPRNCGEGVDFWRNRPPLLEYRSESHSRRRTCARTGEECQPGRYECRAFQRGRDVSRHREQVRASGRSAGRRIRLGQRRFLSLARLAIRREHRGLPQCPGVRGAIFFRLCRGRRRLSGSNWSVKTL